MAQDEIYRMELGGGIGGSFYLGDANSKPYANLGFMGGVVGRYIFNPRMAIKGNIVMGHISGDTGTDFFPENATNETMEGGRPGELISHGMYWTSVPSLNSTSGGMASGAAMRVIAGLHPIC